jgi:hypothetical protein
MMRIQTATAFAATNMTYQCKSSLANAQFVALQQYFSHPRYSSYFPIVTHTSETGTAKGSRLLIATHLNQSNHLANLQEVLGFAVPFASLSTLCKNAEPKPFC